MTRQTGFSLVVKALIRDRATVEVEDAEVAMCEIQQRCCTGAATNQPHHRRPRQRGGSRRLDTNMPANGLATCLACHDFVEGKRSLAYDNGWLVHQTASPRDVPVLRRGEWCTLDDLGGVNPVERQAVI